MPKSGDRGYRIGMGERKKPPLPRRGEHDSLIYAAFMGHTPVVCPPAPEPESRIGKIRVRLNAFSAAQWKRACQACTESILSPAVRSRLMPLLAQAKKRWMEAGERLIARTVARPPSTTPSNTVRPSIPRGVARGNGYASPQRSNYRG
jgi:hypothetical protein